MKREEVIRLIEKMQANGVPDKWCEEFAEAMRQASQKRNALADDFHRAIVYCFVLFTRVGYLNKERRNFLRPTKRSMLMAFGLMLAVIAESIALLAIMVAVGLGAASLIILMFVLLFQLGYVVSKGNQLIGGYSGDDLGLSPSCTQCAYDLSGLDSVLGEKLWVGPESCPECGLRYPAVP